MENDLEGILDISQSLIDSLTAWSETATWFIVAAVVLSAALFISYRARKRILFGEWINRYDSEQTELGKSIADLLLFKLRYIKRTHELSSAKISLWNTFEDIPSFRQNLDKEIDLLASVQLGNYGKIISGTFTFLFRLFPLFIKPASLSGNINLFGEKKTIIHISLENYSPQKWFKHENLLWEKDFPEMSMEDIPDVIEEMAYRIYIDLTGGDLFKSWQCFMYFTKGLRSYLNYTELKRASDLEDAEEQYLKALEYEETNPVVKYNLGVLKYYQYKNDMNDEAILCFKQALNCNDRNLRARASSAMANALGQKYSRYKTGKPNSLDTIIEAVDYAERAVALNKKLDSAYKALAYTTHQLGEALAAREGNNLSVITDPDHRSTKLRISAIQHYKRTLRINKKHFMASNNLANLYLEWAIQLRAQPAEVSWLTTWKYRLTEFYTQQVIIDRTYFLKKAVYHCEEALKVNPSYQFAFDNLGNAWYERKDYNKSYSAYQNALLYAPSYAEAQNDLAMLFLVKEYEGYDLQRAFERHKEALMCVKDELKRKEKLITIFKNRMLELQIPVEEYMGAELLTMD
jgi:tetratricopeptide (TPR) repeat protein